jgi:hypothetical protein
MRSPLSCPLSLLSSSIVELPYSKAAASQEGKTMKPTKPKPRCPHSLSSSATVFIKASPKASPDSKGGKTLMGAARGHRDGKNCRQPHLHTSHHNGPEKPNKPRIAKF